MLQHLDDEIPYLDPTLEATGTEFQLGDFDSSDQYDSDSSNSSTQ